uniref:SFRICE_022104 n=1 Tax=Spodoptera frugiperda TaxID=7108 RepID=A0A2H1VU41_SPOFR
MNLENYCGKQPDNSPYTLSNKPFDVVDRLFKARREENSSVFGFQKDITIVSYIPRLRKCVHMMSSLHHDDEVDPERGDKRKPSIITFYNSTKSGVDVVDKLARTYDVTRNCKRWPLTKNFIKQLGLSLLEDRIRKRKDNPHIPGDIRRRVHEMLHEEVLGPPQKQPRRSQRCSFCPGNKDRKTINGCFKCNAAMCKEHENLMCQNCTDLDNE